jgi:uncharacterized membrane protein
VGSRWLAHEKFGPQRFDARSEVTAVEEGRTLGWVSYPPMKEENRGEGGRVYWDYRLEPDEGGTRLAHHMREEEPRRGAARMKMMNTVFNLPKRVDKAMQTSLRNIKAAAEGQFPAPGAGAGPPIGI